MSDCLCKLQTSGVAAIIVLSIVSFTGCSDEAESDPVELEASKDAETRSDAPADVNIDQNTETRSDASSDVDIEQDTETVEVKDAIDGREDSTRTETETSPP